MSLHVHWTGMPVVTPNRARPSTLIDLPSIFLAGPTNREGWTPWRGEAMETLRNTGVPLRIYAPEFDPAVDRRCSGLTREQKRAQIIWETQALEASDCVLFWVPRDMEKLPGLTTNIEFGAWKNHPKTIFGAPDNAEHVGYMWYWVETLGIPCAKRLDVLCGIAIGVASCTFRLRNAIADSRLCVLAPS